VTSRLDLDPRVAQANERARGSLPLLLASLVALAGLVMAGLLAWRAL